VRNPLYVWTHLELRRVFGIDVPLGPETAREIWDEANNLLPDLPARTLLARFAVTTIATTDDPCDDLAAHQLLRDAGGAPTMIPTFRPDAAHRLLDDPPAWNAWADRLETASGMRVEDLDSLLAALTTRYGRFAALGARASDHGLACLPNSDRDPRLADAAVQHVRSGQTAPGPERDALLLEIVALAAHLAADEDGVLQLHLGARRDLSPRILGLLGHDAGADAVDDLRQGPGLVRVLAGCERAGLLPRTVLYNANPADATLFATVAGAFSRAKVAPLVQWGPPWWFNDHEDGMRRQLDQLSRTGRLTGFLGMVTDSRSLLSMTRHELFRRILCDTLGRDVDAGLIPADHDLLSGVVRRVCLDNSVDWFGL
jgi:glucuronate isomerase